MIFSITSRSGIFDKPSWQIPRGDDIIFGKVLLSERINNSGVPSMIKNGPEIKRVCIYGVGGVGGYYGGRIAEAFQKDRSKGREVYFIARGEHLKAIRQNGLVVKTPDRIITAAPTRATHDIGEIPAPDLILLCTKSYDLPIAVASIKSQTRESTVVMPLLNGIDIYDRIRTVLQRGIVLPSCVYLGTYIESPGVINQSGGNGIILSGKDPLVPAYEAENVREFFDEIKIGFEWKDDPYPAIWEKFIFIAAFGLVTAFSGKTLGEVMDAEELRQTVYRIVQEIIAIAAKKGIKLAVDISDRSMNKAHNFPHDARTSYQRDIESRPRPNEGDLYGATILREGAVWGVPTPITKMAYSRILQLDGKQ
jgi:2-dehydropantoate 2-reductase